MTAATHDHVLSHQPWTYCLPVSDGTQTLLHIGCRCGKDTHVGEIAAWTPKPAAAVRPVEIVPCQWCGAPIEKTERRGGQKYHRACAKEATRAINRDNQRAKWAARREAVCHGGGECIHGDGEIQCHGCAGTGIAR